jgi:hypothetical protein
MQIHIYVGTTINNSNHVIYKNGSNIISSTSINLNSGVNGNFYLAALNNTTSGATQFSNRQQAYASIGQGLSSSQSSTYYTIIQAFQTSLSRQV